MFKCIGISLLVLTVFALFSLAQYDNDIILEFSWEPASGNVDHYNVYLSVDGGVYSLVDTTPTAPTSQDLYAVPVVAEHGKTYRLQVEAEDAGGTTGPMSDPSDLVTVDLTPSSTPVVTDDGDVTALSTHFHITWMECNDAESGILEYQYCIGTTVGGTDVRDWVSVGLFTDISAGVNLSLGKTYYAGVRAINNAGTPSAVGVTDGIQIVLPAPGRPVRP